MKASDARIVLTGASGGIGRAAAAAFVQAGAALLLVGRSPARLAEQVRELSQPATSSGRLAWHEADLTDPDAVAGLGRAAAAFGANVVVHGAGVPSFGRFESISAAQMQQVLQTNLLAPMLLTQALLPQLRSQPQAQLIFVGSVLGRLALPGYAVYSASKFGLRGFAEALRRELADGPVRVQYLGPRSTRTAFNDAGVLAYNRATGTAMDEPALVAAALLQLLQGGAAERFLGFPESLAVRLNGALPGWLDRFFTPHRRSLPAAPAATTHRPLSTS